MWFAVETDAVGGAAALTAGVAQRLAEIDLSGLGDAVRAAMPGAGTSIAAADDLLVMPAALDAVVLRLADEGGRLRLASTQYAAADTVARAGVTAARAAPSPTPPPGIPGHGR